MHYAGAMRWVVTGASRGIGLELVRQLSERGEQVWAFARDPGAGPLSRLVAPASGRVTAVACDVGSQRSVGEAAARLGGEAVDVLVNNAGVMGTMTSLEGCDFEDMLHTIDVNALGALRVARALLANLMAGSTRRIVSISSGMGSIGDNTSGGAYGYRMSKAALNMANRSLSVDLRDRGFTCVVMNPGWVQTDMGGGGAPTPVQESVSKMLAIIDGLTPAQSGSFLNYRGGTLEW